ncbi:hypothetical protein ACF0H5_011523 [Mactra antiquata]
MVLRTIIKRGTKVVPKLDAFMPGYTKESVKHHISILPLYVFTAGGCVVCAWYCWKLLSYQDTILLKKKERQDVKPDEKIPLWISVADLSKQKNPDNKPSL